MTLAPAAVLVGLILKKAAVLRPKVPAEPEPAPPGRPGLGDSECHDHGHGRHHSLRLTLPVTPSQNRTFLDFDSRGRLVIELKRSLARRISDLHTSTRRGPAQAIQVSVYAIKQKLSLTPIRIIGSPESLKKVIRLGKTRTISYQ